MDTVATLADPPPDLVVAADACYGGGWLAGWGGWTGSNWGWWPWPGQPGGVPDCRSPDLAPRPTVTTTIRREPALHNSWPLSTAHF